MEDIVVVVSLQLLNRLRSRVLFNLFRGTQFIGERT